MWARSPLEARIITSFLQAADYELVELGSWRSQRGTPPHISVDMGIMLLENPESEVEQVSSMLREAAGWHGMPIVAIVPEEAVQEEDGLFFLVRPIRLFELVGAVREAMLYGNSTRPENPRGLRNANPAAH